MLRLKRIQSLFTIAVATVWAWLSRHWLITIGTGLLLAAMVWGTTIYANLSTRSLRYDLQSTNIDKVPSQDIGIVFGAGVTKSGEPTPYLRWRIETGVQLYKAHKVKKLLMTGDNSRQHYNEPEAMRRYAEKLGMPANKIVLDYAGFNTYDSCYRAAAIFRVKTAILVTQGYHLPRAVMACNSLGVSSIGVNAVHTKGRSWGVNYIVREWLSTDKIVLQLLFKPAPTALGNVEPIHL